MMRQGIRFALRLPLLMVILGWVYDGIEDNSIGLTTWPQMRPAILQYAARPEEGNRTCTTGRMSGSPRRGRPFDSD